MPMELNIDGMTCNNCVGHVTKAIAAVPGVESVIVDLDSCKASISGTPDADAVRAAVVAAGYATTD